ncbi:UDP-2,4-diacetamido-2,4,6-trideoxy-beta-L-altropyranose hydrolase [Halomonas sp.]|uniref:UDP-2,4-diacetamido-2,4, 6-trideoxy-beta-L-altropyranose hydrolase n=1 Tax=Halomonas sp. TaxID=1486246 RepID=UPI003A8EE8A8
MGAGALVATNADSPVASASPDCVVFRVDASLDIGTGHVMRCLTLAEALRERLGTRCHFLSREHAGHLIDVIEARGFQVHRLGELYHTSQSAQAQVTDAAGPYHASWLGVDWRTDAMESASCLELLAPDWLVVDHYALDARWEAAVCPAETRLLVIDDLADREHCADLLLDQNLGRRPEDYDQLVPSRCRLLLGPQYALLRPEFSQWRQPSLARRDAQPRLERLLISLGGVDRNNVTGAVLQALRRADLPETCHVTVVMGATAPWVNEVSRLAEMLEQPTEVVINVTDMAKRMAEADLAIGAAGSTSWERCCLGLPTLILVLAENQRGVAAALRTTGAAIDLDLRSLEYSLEWGISHASSSSRLALLSRSAAQVSDGEGALRVISALAQ